MTALEFIYGRVTSWSEFVAFHRFAGRFLEATEAVLVTSATLLGAIVGSFLNVVIYRLPAGTFWSAGARSVCANPECEAPVPAYLNLPIVGWMWLRGRAKCCGFRLSPRYPLVEALTALLFFLLWMYPPYRPAFIDGQWDWMGLTSFVLFAFFAANLIANTFIDIDHRILPDVLTKSGMVVGVVGALIVPGLAGRFELASLSPRQDSVLFSLVGLAVGYGATQSVRLSAQWLFRKEAMGFGDVKLMGAIGAFLGWEDVLLTFFVGCVLGAVIGVVHRLLTDDAYIAFGPFLAGGAVITLFVGDSIREGFAAWQHWQQTSPYAMHIVLGGSVVSLILLVVLIRRGRAP